MRFPRCWNEAFLLAFEALDARADEPRFLRRMQASTKANATIDSDQIVKRQVEEIAEFVAMERACEVAERLTQSVSCRSTARMYLLAAGASLIGVDSAAVVFFLLS